MVQSIVSSGVAIGCIYALIGITYNVMFSASRVFSFTAGTLGMLGGVLGSLFIIGMGLPVASASLALAGGALFGIVTEIVAVRPVLKSLDQHLYVLSTLALALMVQQFTAIEWGTEPRPFPRLFDLPAADSTSSSGCRCSPARSSSSASNCSIAARWSATPSWRSPRTTTRRARSACRSAACAWRAIALAGVIGALAGFAGGEMLLAFFANAPMLTFYGFVPVALGGMGNNRGAVVAGLAARAVSAGREFPGRRHLRLRRGLPVFIVVLLAAARRPCRRRHCSAASDGDARRTLRPSRANVLALRARSARRCRSWCCCVSASRSRCSAAAIGA